MFSQIIVGIIFVLFCAYLIARYYESGGARRTMEHLHKVWGPMTASTRWVLGTLIVVCVLEGGSKGSPITSLFRMLFWNGQDWALMEAYQDNSASDQAVATASNAVISATNTATLVEDFVDTNNVVTFSFDWHSPNRMPYHDQQNVLGRTVWVQPTNILGVLYEDHYVAFNESATTNPAVILIEYARKLDNGTVQRISSPTITNSFPVMVPITLQSGTHTCYWFRCEVPAAFTNCCVRDWNGEALFGSPEGSGKGFDLLGTLLIDDGNNIWQGATTNMVIGVKTNSVKNGIILE